MGLIRPSSQLRLFTAHPVYAPDWAGRWDWRHVYYRYW